MPGLFSGFCSSANHEMCLSPKTIYPLRRVSRPQRDREEEEEEEKEQEKERYGQCSISDRPARKEGEPGNTAYSPGCTHSEALAKAAESG